MNPDETQPDAADGEPALAVRSARMEWSNALFLSWPVDAATLGSLIPHPLKLELFEGQAWATVIPLVVSGARHTLAPPIPGFSSFKELSLRTYVRCGTELGVFLLSVDTSSLPTVWFARGVLHLPCFRASIAARQDGESLVFRSQRRHQGTTDGRFECRWRARESKPRPRPGELAHFVTGKRFSFTVHRGQVHASKMHCAPPALREAHLETLDCTLLEAAGLPTPLVPPVPFHCDRLGLSMERIKCRATVDSPSLLDPALSPPPLGFRGTRRIH